MIGGFLGAGKTTAVAALAHRLSSRGLKVGLITNDQGQELVDTAMLRSKGYATEEIPGGCFCCRFNSLVDAADRLSESNRPDVFIAEPVGSCTDLVATVTYPLRRMYGDQFLIAPLSVLVDPVRAQRVLGLADGGQFSEKVLYIYRKQLEEADLIVVNKREILDALQLDRLRLRLAEQFPRAKVLAVSARTGAGLDDWFNQITATEQVARVAMDVDYEVYAEGEALLGWLNATVILSNQKSFDGNQVIRDLANTMSRLLADAGAEVAHLKMTLEPEDAGLGDLAVINLVRNDFVPELSQELSDWLDAGKLILNCRAEASPDVLHAALTQALTETGKQHPHLFLRLEHLEHFRPGKPQPTHRDA